MRLPMHSRRDAGNARQ